jgi:hypothetical protein
VRSIYALMVGFIIRRFALLTLTPFDESGSTRYQPAINYFNTFF